MVVINEATTLRCSETFVGSLCKEVDNIRIRCNQITYSIQSSNNKILVLRLRQEFNRLVTRKKNIFHIAKRINENHLTDPLSLEFLLEISGRPILSSNN